MIVEFARQAEERGADRFAAATEAARTSLRPILMTSSAFILGVVPLMLATGAGAEPAVSSLSVIRPERPSRRHNHLERGRSGRSARARTSWSLVIGGDGRGIRA
jgi:hypothetical protein